MRLIKFKLLNVTHAHSVHKYDYDTISIHLDFEIF